jgi:cyanophycin synthetase
VILFSMEQENELIDRWVRRGRKAVVLETDEQGELMQIRDGRRSMPIGYVHQIPATFDGNARMNVQNAMAAAAAAHAAGAHLDDIRSGLRTFSSSFFQSPGRLNLFESSGVKVLVDYAHNPAGLRTIGEFVERMTSAVPVAGRPTSETWQANLRVGVIGTAGDRRDDDIRELGRVAAVYFDEVIIREDRNTRGRVRGETASLVAEGVKQAQREGARAGSVEVVNDEMEAVRRALDRSRPGDLILVCVDDPEGVIQELEARRAKTHSRS